MRTFASEIFEVVRGKQVFEKLFVDDVCLIDEFEEEIKNNPQYYSELKTIYAYMDLFASGQTLPKSKFREIKGGRISKKRYEFKSKNLRVYIFGIFGGKMVVLGGYKKTQKADIAKFNSIVKEYCTQDKL